MTDSWVQWVIMLIVTVAVNAAVIYGTYRAFEARTEERLKSGDKCIERHDGSLRALAEAVNTMAVSDAKQTEILLQHERRIIKLEDCVGTK